MLISNSLLLTLSKYNFSKKLLLTFNSYTFYMLSNIIDYICDYYKKKAQIILYVDVVKQVLIIFNIRSVFTESLIKTIKKDRS